MTGHSKNLIATKYLINKAIEKQESEEELDGVFLVCGEEGSGKSNTILNIINIWEEQTGKKISIENVTRNIKELLFTLSKSRKTIVALDEGAELKNTNLWDKLVRKVEEAFVVSRANANICLISFPNPFKLNSYFRDDRSKGVFFCYKRKKVYFYTRTAFRKIREQVSKNNKILSINDFCEKYSSYATIIEYNVPKYEGHLKEEYDKRKRENIDNILENIIKEIGIEQKYYSITKTAKLLGIAKKTLYKAIEETKIELKWNATRTQARLSEKDIEIIQKHLNPENTNNPNTMHTHQ